MLEESVNQKIIEQGGNPLAMIVYPVDMDMMHDIKPLAASSHELRHEVAINVLTPSIAWASTFSTRLVDRHSTKREAGCKSNGLQRSKVALATVLW